MTAYKQLLHDSQYFVDTPVILPTDDDEFLELSEGDIVPDGWGEITVAEASQFAKRIQEPRERVIERNAILHAFEINAIDAETAMAELESRKLFGDPEDFLCAYARGVRGLLCHRCNIRIGGWDDQDFRTAALAWLEKGK